MTATFNVRATAEVYQREGPTITLQPTEVMYSTSRFHEAAIIEVTGVSQSPLDEVREVSLGNTEVEADSASDADASQDPLVPDSTANLFINNYLIGGGEVQDISTDAEGLVSFTAVDSIRNIIQNNFTHSFAEGVPIQTAIRTVIEDAGIIPYPGSELGQGETAGPNADRLPGESAYNIEVTEAIEDSIEQQPQAGMAPFITDREFTNVSSLEALDTLVSDAGWYFLSDNANVLQIAPNLYSEHLNVDEHELEYILETTAGLQSPPYQRVIVTGGEDRLAAWTSSDVDSAPAPEGEETEGDVPNGNRLLSRTPVQAEAGQGAPVYRYEDKSITTQSNAQAVANGILEEFQRQQGSGEVTVTGDPEIRPLDSVVMPDRMGGESYIASSVEHTIDSDNGFQTLIGVGGVLDTGVEG